MISPDSFFKCLVALFLTLQSEAQVKRILPNGSYPVGYTVVVLPTDKTLNGVDSVKLVLNIWYPTEEKAGKTMRLLDYLYYHLSYQPPEPYAEVTKQRTDEFKKFTSKNFGRFEQARWNTLEDETTSALINAPYSSSAFPLIMGRLRAFSTTLTNEFLASHGYVVCMINGVEDYPPDNRSAYHQQLIHEINYFDEVQKYLKDSLKIVTSTAGLLGFSGGGFSQFMAPMHSDNYDAVALLESGIFLDGDLFDIVSSHPYYHPERFGSPLLFLYNEQRFNDNKASKNFFTLKSKDKYLVLFRDSTQHHWDFATEGMIAATFLNSRDKAIAEKQVQNFRTMHELLLKFLNRYLKGDKESTIPQGQMVIESGKKARTATVIPFPEG